MSEQINALQNDNTANLGDLTIQPEAELRYGCITGDYKHKFEPEILPWVPLRPNTPMD